MSVYNVNGQNISSVYALSGVKLSQAYDVDGIKIFGDEPTFLDNATVTNIYTSSMSQQPQGGCIDEDGNIYVCFYSAGIFLKHNISAGTNTQVSFTPNAYGHANGMAYNPNTGYLYLASMKSTGEVYVFDKSFNLVATKYAKDENGNIFTCWNMAYDRVAERFITFSTDNSGVIYLFDDNFDLIRSSSFIASDWANTRQDIETDGSYIYALSYSPNKINVFDMSGTLIKSVSCTAFSGEPESMCFDWENDIYYIEGISGNFVIRQAVFKD